MKKIISLLVLWSFLFGSLFLSYAKPVIQEQKWIISGAGRSIYLLKLDGSEREILFENVADSNARIEVLTNSYNGKIILCKVVSMARFSYWLVDLDMNEQYLIIEDLKVRPSNTIISKDGTLASFTTSEQAGIKIWLYDVKKNTLKEFGEDITDGMVRFVRFSYDGKYALYSKLTGTNRDYYTILCLRDFTKNRDYELTTRKDGDFDIGDFYFDGKNILMARTLPGDDYNSLWDFNLAKKTFTYVMDITEEFISAISISRDGNQIALCSYNPRKPGKNFFWTLHKDGVYNLTYINDIPAGMIGLRVSHDGKYFLYSTENSPTYIASMDGSLNEELSDLVSLPNLKDAMWYNHPPYPPLVSAKASDAQNIVNWESSKEGTYSILGYKVYRSLFPDKKNLTFLTDVKSDVTTYIDVSAKVTENYYYLVRSYDTDLTESIPSNHALLDRTPPQIFISAPLPGLLTNQKNILVKGNANDLESGIKNVTVNNTVVTLDKDGYFSLPSLFDEGQNLIMATVTDNSDNQSSVSFEITVDSVPPEINVDFPQNNTELIAIDTTMRGNITEKGSGLKKVTLNGTPVILSEDGSFNLPIVIVPGKNEFVWEVIDNADNLSQKMITIKGVKKIIVVLTIGSNQMIVNDIPSLVDAPPFIDEESGRTLVPARFVVEPIGGTIEFDDTTHKITIIRESDKIELWIGKNSSLVNGTEKKIDSTNDKISPRIENGRTFLPLRFVTENIGFLVQWDPSLHQIKLIFPKNS
jgi:hypothetical protein